MSMDPITAGIISGGVGLVGNFMQGQQSQQMAQDQMNFQGEMSNTAHQREVRDLQAAGLNPILSALGGSGASTPGGAMGTAPDFGGTLSTAFKVGQQQQIQNTQLDNTEADTANKHAQSSLIENQSAATAKDIESKALQNSLLKTTMPSLIKEAKAKGDWTGPAMMMNSINSGVGSAAQLLKMFPH